MNWMLLPLKRYVDFSGRSRRMEYWMFFLAVILFYFTLVLVAYLLLRGAMLSALEGMDPAAGPGARSTGMMNAALGGGIIGIVMLVTWLALLIPSIAVGVRRLHDIDRSGWWLMLGYGPWILGIVSAIAQSGMLAGILNLASMIGFIIVVIFAFLPGTRGPNRFGHDPKGEDLGQVFA